MGTNSSSKYEKSETLKKKNESFTTRVPMFTNLTVRELEASTLPVPSFLIFCSSVCVGPASSNT